MSCHKHEFIFLFCHSSLSSIASGKSSRQHLCVHTALLKISSS